METRSEAAQDTKPERSEALERLEAFLGEWRVEGKNLDGAEEFASTDVEGTQSIRWLPGDLFLMQSEVVRLDAGQKGSRETTWIIGWDAEQGRYTVHVFDDAGVHRTYDVTAEGPTWSFEGADERGTVVFDEGGETYRGFWERSVGGRWVALCEYTASRLH